MSLLLDYLWNASTLGAVAVLALGNVLIFVVSVVSCWLMMRMFSRRQIFDRFEPVRGVELLAAAACVILNTVVSIIGWLLWKHGAIELAATSIGWIGFDVGLMVLAMDFGMYFSHRLVHHQRLYPIVHRFHHRHEVTNPISLFVLHPLEVIGFGALMIAFLLIYRMSPIALMAYLALNVFFGTLGHSGVEPLPRFLLRVPLLNLVGTSTFHAEHHTNQRYNFGFYTLLWDYLLGTLDPEYWQQCADPVTWREQRQSGSGCDTDIN